MIPFVRLADVAYGRVDRVSPLIRRVVAPNPGPFTGPGTGTYIVGHPAPGSGVAVIDPGPLDDGHLEALLAAVQGQVVSHVLVTHTHRDHAPLARPFAQAVGAPVLAARPPGAGSRQDAVDEDDDADFKSDQVLADGETVAGNGWSLKVLATPGHASNHLSFALKEENALFSGDHVMGWSTTVVAPPHGDMSDYLASLEAVIARRFSTIWPTHGAPITEPEPFLAAYLAHRLEREAQIVARLAAGDRTIGEMVPELYGAVDRRLWPAASLSILAHLIKLTRQGRVSADPGPAMDAAWGLTAGPPV